MIYKGSFFILIIVNYGKIVFSFIAFACCYGLMSMFFLIKISLLIHINNDLCKLKEPKHYVGWLYQLHFFPPYDMYVTQYKQ